MTELSVLVVDDDPANVARLKELLTPFQLPIMSASNGVEALAVIERQKGAQGFPGIIITDLKMPKLDGMALAVVETDGLDPGKTRERPGQAYGGILPAGKQDQGGVGAGRHGHDLQYFGGAHDGRCATILGVQQGKHRWPMRAV